MSESELIDWVAVKSIVVVEDDNTSRMLLDGLLRSIGAHRVRVAVDGEDAINVIEAKGVPDIIFCDWMMPHMDGIGLLTVVKERYPHSRFIMVTAKKDPEDVRSAASLKVDGYILKPYSRATVLASLSRLKEKEDHPPA